MLVWVLTCMVICKERRVPDLCFNFICLHACRDLLAAPVGRTLFFAGEATHPAINPCLQAAMDTGLRAAREVEFAAQNVSRL